MANLGNVAIKPKGEWIIGVVYKPLNAVTHNGNLYLALKENAVEPADDGINWWLILEGVPVATKETLGKVKPDGETITIDEDGTLYGASQVPEGVTYINLDEELDELQEKLPLDADTLQGHAADYFATKKDLENIEISGGGTVTFPFEVPYQKSIDFKGGGNTGRDPAYAYRLSAENNQLHLYVIAKEQGGTIISAGEIELTPMLDTTSIYSGKTNMTLSKFKNIILGDQCNLEVSGEVHASGNFTLPKANGGMITFNSFEDKDGTGLSICQDGLKYEELIKIDGYGIANFTHSVNLLGGNLGLDRSNSQQVKFKNFSLGQNGMDTQFWLLYNTEPIFNYNSNLGYAKFYKKIVLDDGITLNSEETDYKTQIDVDGSYFYLKGCSNGTNFSNIMEIDLDNYEIYFYGSINIKNSSSIYFADGGNAIRGVIFKNAFNIPITGIEIPTFFVNHSVFGESQKKGICFANPMNYNKNLPYYQIFQLQQDKSNKESQALKIVLNSSDLTSRTEIATITENGVTFHVPVTATNISKTTSELKLAQQELTEQDLELIEVQQLLTEQELENIETQQLLTEIDLEKIEGGQAL